MPAKASIRLLCTGDLHLGRYPSRVPLNDRLLSVEYVWEQIVSYAIGQEVDALVLTGDVVDADNRFFEAFRPLQRGLARLAKADIPTYCIAGNHDYDVFPRLHGLLDSGLVHFLGRDGQWTTAPLMCDGETVLRFAGWSFPARHVTSSPLGDFPGLETDVPTIGILHAELDNPASTYNPVRRQDLNDVPVAAWLLGHIHRPAAYDHRDGCILYTGSPQPLDPGEEGAHGPWLVTVEPSGSVQAEQIPLATVRYATLEVDLSGVDTKNDFERRTITSVEEDLAAVRAEQGELRRVVYRLRYAGRTALHRQVETYCAQVRDDFETSFGDVAAAIDTVDVQTQPKLNLEQLARGSDPSGVLAGLLLELQRDEAPGEDVQRLFDLAYGDCEGVYLAAAYGALRREEGTADPPGLEQVRALAIRQGLLLLDEMMAQVRDETPMP